MHGDGARTVATHCEVDDRPSVMRDITNSLDGDCILTGCFVRLSVDDRFMGSGWFSFQPKFAECEALTLLEGRVSKRMDLKRPLRTFQSHAIACDALHLRLSDRSRPGTIQPLEQVLLSSPDHRSAAGPMLFSVGLHANYAGEQRVTVGAGTLYALHFQFVSAPGLPTGHPPYDVWCTTDGEYLFPKGGVAGNCRPTTNWSNWRPAERR